MSCVASPTIVSLTALQRDRGVNREPTAPAVLNSFNTWAFKRQQPSDIKLIEAQIAAAMRAADPIPFVLYWGKGPRTGAAPPDLACLTYMASMLSRIEAVYPPGAVMTLIFTDTHAELNGHPATDAAAYFAAVTACLDRRRFHTATLSSIVRTAGPFPGAPAPVDCASIDRLVRSAERWFRGGGSAREGAERYLHANAIERRAVEIAYPGAIFATFNGSEFDFLFPAQLPKFYMYSLRKGWSVKPWFMSATGDVISAAS